MRNPCLGPLLRHGIYVGDILTAGDMNTYVRDQFTSGFATGSYLYVCANAATDATETLWQGAWLYCNGASVLRATYSALDTYLASLTPARPFGTVDGTHVTLPHLTSRVPIAHAPSGGHADMTTLGASDGVALANRRPKHRHTTHIHANIGQSGPDSVTAGTQISFVTTATGGTGAGIAQDGGSGNANDPLDAPAYLVAGVWVIKT